MIRLEDLQFFRCGLRLLWFGFSIYDSVEPPLCWASTALGSSAPIRNAQVYVNMDALLFGFMVLEF
jgi:hypothetical protein